MNSLPLECLVPPEAGRGHGDRPQVATAAAGACGRWVGTARSCQSQCGHVQPRAPPTHHQCSPHLPYLHKEFQTLCFGQLHTEASLYATFLLPLEPKSTWPNGRTCQLFKGWLITYNPKLSEILSTRLLSNLLRLPTQSCGAAKLCQTSHKDATLSWI